MGVFDIFRSAKKSGALVQPGLSEKVGGCTYEDTFQTAFACLEQGHRAGAKALFNRVADGVPEEGDACHMLGFIYFGEDNFAESAKWCEVSLRRPIMNSGLRLKSLTMLALCYLKLGRRSEARACIERLRPLTPDFAEELAKQL
jgi:hypothetical protein